MRVGASRLLDKENVVNISFGMIILNGNYVLREVLESVYDFAHQILIAEGPVQYWVGQGVHTSTDGTNQILDNFPDPDNKIKVWHGQYGEKTEQANAYMGALADDADYVWNLDCDEVFKPDDLERVFSLLGENKYTSAGFKSRSFYGGFDKTMSGFEWDAEFIRVRKVYPGSFWSTHRPPTIVHNSWSLLPEKHLSSDELFSLGVQMYHYSYVFPEQVRQKLSYYKAAVSKENCIDNYFEEVYLPWVLGHREEVEEKFDGVHEFKPNVRGSCRTIQFKQSDHPQIIRQNMGELKNKFNEQLVKYVERR